MMTVREARYRRTLDRRGTKVAEVEVNTGDGPNSQLLAYFCVGEDGAYKLSNVLVNDAATEVDWFDNSEHRAFSDVTPQLFSGPDHIGAIDRDSFAAQVLAWEGIEDALERHLNQSIKH